jgi:hypothetical protein
VVYDAWPTLLAARPPTSRVRAVGATIQLLKHAPTEAIAPVLLESQRVSKEKPDPRDEVGLMVRRSTTGNNRNVISKRLRVAMTRAKDVFHLMVLQRFFTTPASAR